MRRISNTPLLKIFTSLFLIIYTFVPPVLAVDDLYTVDNSQDVLDEGVSDPEWIVQEPEQEIILISTDILPKLKNSPKEPAPGSVINTLLTYTPITDPITLPGKCIDDAAGKALNCTANDVSIANVTSVQILDDGCQSPADTVTFKATWNVESTSSERYDIGLYFATAGQTNARTGACSVSTLPNSPTSTWYNFDDDNCGDISSSTTVHPQITLTVKCADPDGNNTLNVPYCTSWDNNAGGVCNGPSDAIPGTGSKCNCNNGFEVPITVPYEANIEVKKSLTPSTDEGNFNLSIDSNTQASCVGDNGTTGKVVVGAGTSTNPGATHTIGENSTGCATDISNYNTTISCVNRGTSTFHGGNPLVIATTGPLSVPVVKDDDIVCTVTNTRKTGHIIVQKTTLPSGSQTVFSITASSTNGSVLNGATGTVTDSLDHDYQVTTGTYSVNETVPTGWIQTANTCTDVVVGENETKYCEITNTKLPTLTINKVLIPASNSGIFNLKIDDTVYASSIGNNGTTGAQIVGVGTHTFSEEAANPSTILSDYAVTYGGDAGCNTNGSIILAAGENKTCTITNVTLGSLTIVKDAVPNSSQDFNFTTTGYGLSNFSLDDDSDITLSNSKIFSHLLPGIYGVSETPVTGWDLTNTSCSDQSSANAIDISAGETVTCTFTNTQRGIISGFKLNDPDGLLETTTSRTGVPGWTIELWKDGNKIAESITSATGFFSFENLIPGDYQLREVLVSGWIRIYPTDERLYVTLIPGENDTDNNFINVKYPTITVYKNVDENGDGDLNDSVDIIGATDWTWDINGAGNYATGSKVDNKMPGTYTISEDQKTNYHVTSLICGQTDYGAVESQSVTLTSGQDLICTFTNTRDTGTLRVVKILNNDNGGQLHKDDFSFTIDSGSPIFFEADGQNDFTKYAGLSYDITEVSVPGYTTTYNNCDDVVVPKNGVATCTITNNDIAPSLTLIKTVTNNNGGLALASDWTLTATGPTTISGAGGVTSDNTFSAGTYTLSESSGPSGYSAGNWNCTGVQNTGNQITLGLGQSATCTIVNDDIAPTLRLTKIVNNNYGGNATPANWILYAQGSELGFSDLGNSTTFHTVKAGITYDLSESTTPTGYQASWWNCNGGEYSENTVKLGVGQNITCTITNSDIAPTITLTKIVTNDNGGSAGANDFGLTIGGTNVTSGQTLPVNSNTPIAINEAGLAGYSFVSITGDEKCPRVLGGTVTLNEGENISCTITNDDIAPSLQLIKTVTKDNGGNTNSTDWTLSATGTATPISGSGGTISGSTFLAGTYTLSETGGPTGYSAGDWSCTGVQNSDNQITLGLGQSAVCTINNDDIAPKLTLIKTVTNNNGGTKVVSDFPLFINLIPAISGITYSLSANVQYTVSEANLSGYTPSTWGGDCTADGKITLQPGDDKTCTITNDDQAGTLIVKKVLVKNHGGNEAVTDFSFQVNDGTLTPFEADGQNNLTVNAGTYNIVEPHVDGYMTNYNNCSNVEISNGETETCTITNSDIAPTITLTKVVVNDNGGNAGPNDFGLTIGDTGVTSGQKLEVNANTPIALNEAGLTGYSFVSITGDEECPRALGGTITLDEGEDITCTITNDDQAPHLTLVKNVDNNYGGLAIPTDWILTATGPTTISGAGGVASSSTFSAGTYTLSESTGPTGYSASDWSCTGVQNTENQITLGLGQSATCTITNSDIQPKLTVIKHVITDNGGTAEASDFTMLVTGINVTQNSFAGDENGTVIGLDAGPYSVDENEYFGYTKTPEDDCSGTIAIGEEKTCTITNDDQTGTIIIKKDVLNGEGMSDGVYSDITFDVSLNNNIENTQGIRDSEETPLRATFDGLNAGDYTVNEVVPDGFIFEGCYEEELQRPLRQLIDSSFTLGNGETLYLICKNQLINPVLDIAKTNNTGGADMVAGDNVLYTLTITAPTTDPEENYVLNNVQVTDLLPAGFTYMPGTWTSTSSTTTDPLYTNGLGIWNLGTMTEGETVILTYIAHISDTQAPGTYENIAWAKGTSLIYTQVLANEDEASGYFVTSSVKVVENIEEGDVLGITDHVTLPNTGANTSFTIAGAISMLLGFMILILNPRKKMKIMGITVVSILGIVSLLFPSQTYAASDIIANISQPQTPTNQTSFKIAYSALDIQNRVLSIQCYETTYGAFDLPHSANSEYCLVDNTVTPTDGTYEFYVVVTPEGEVPVTSNKVSVVIDRQGPSPVAGYTKTTNGCINTLNFTTANDSGQTIGIQIFRSTTLSFTADNSTFIKLITPVTSNQSIAYQDTPPTCDKPYYYGIRAIDIASNISASVGDTVVVTTILPPVVTPTQESAVEGTTTNTETNTSENSTETDTTDNTDTNTNDTTTPQDTSEDVKGTATQNNSVWSWLKYVLIGIGVASLAGITYIYVTNRRKA